MMRVGLIGLGEMGRNHLRVIHEHPEVTLVAVADQDPTLLASALAATGARCFPNGAAMLETGGLDAVVIASPTTTHYDLVIQAVSAGIAVLVEKPLAATWREALDIVRVAPAAGAVPVQVGHVERYNPAVVELARGLRARLPVVYAVASRRAGPLPVRIRDVGVTIDLATHDVEILSWIAGERPSSVYAEVTKRRHQTHEDLLFGLLRYPSGTKGMVDVNWLTPVKRRSLIVLGDEGMFELDYLSQRLTWVPTFGNAEELEVQKQEPLKAQFDDFVQMVRTDSCPRVTAEDGAWAVVVADGFLESARLDRPVHLPPILTDYDTRWY
jgi:UDP-N-acetylglucosamine 3-dehydrogenase